MSVYVILIKNIACETAEMSEENTHTMYVFIWTLFWVQCWWLTDAQTKVPFRYSSLYNSWVVLTSSHHTQWSLTRVDALNTQAWRWIIFMQYALLASLRLLSGIIICGLFGRSRRSCATLLSISWWFFETFQSSDYLQNSTCYLFASCPIRCVDG